MLTNSTETHIVQHLVSLTTGLGVPHGSTASVVHVISVVHIVISVAVSLIHVHVTRPCNLLRS